MSDPDAIEAPAALPKALIAIWHEVEPQVDTRIGAVGLEALCLAVYRLRDARDRVSRDGLIVADARGNPSQHPALAIEKAAAAEVRSWMAKFGCG